jgi:CubicO group peptidase (beta-lactamase class C family)
LVAAPEGPGIYALESAAREITLRHLLTHTSGLSYGSGPGGDRWAEAGITGWYLAHHEEPIRATVERMADLPLTAQPGESWGYGYSTDVLGAVIEAASGMPLDRFVTERILEPLQMDDTFFYLPASERDRLVTVYGLRRDEPLARAPDGPGMQAQGQYVDGPRMSFSGGAGLLSTASDYSRFLQMLLNEGELGGARILTPESVREMTSNQVGDLYREGEVYWEPGTGFGLGFRVRLDPDAAGVPSSVGEFGWLGAYHSYYWVDPAEALVVIHLAQVSPAAGLDDDLRVRELVYGAIEGP